MLSSNMQCLLGLQCNDFTMIAADQTRTNSIIVMKHDEDKLLPVAEKLIMGVNGDTGDTIQFSQFVAKNIQLYKMKNAYELDTAAAVHFTRKNLAESLRNGCPFMVNLLMGGYSEEEGGQLYYLDCLATCVKVPFATHGFGGLFCISILDNYHRPDLTEMEAYDIMKLCVREIHQRLFINLQNFQVKVVSKKGITTLPLLTYGTLL